MRSSKTTAKEKQIKLSLQDVLRKWDEKRLSVWGKNTDVYMTLLDCIHDLGKIAETIIITSEEDVRKYLLKHHTDENGTCGIDCKCEDSCLEFFCRCGNSGSSNRIGQCDICGEWNKPS